MIIIAPDKYKGSMSAEEAAAIMACAVRDAGYVGEIKECPMSDGGEGMPSKIWGNDVIMVSEYVGLANEGLCREPLPERGSYELGRYLMEEYGKRGKRRLKGKEKLYIGVGGTMICDGGAGMLQALGARFFDNEGGEVGDSINVKRLGVISRVDMSGVDKAYWQKHLYILSDVKAHLTDGDLSAMDFVEQKGAQESDKKVIREGLERIRELCGEGKESKIDGAGGGLGFAFATVLGCRYGSGAEEVIKSYEIKWDGVEMIITGEGCIDNQTAGGKVVEMMRRIARRHNIMFRAIGGYVEKGLRDEEMISTIEEKREFEIEKAKERLYDKCFNMMKKVMCN